MRSKIVGSALFSAATAALSLFPRTSEAATVTLVAAFDPNQGQLPESITRDFDGNVILSMAGAHTIAKIIPDGQHAPVNIATLPVASGAFSLGVKVSEDGDIFACSAAFSASLDAAHVWRISPSGAVSEFAHLDAAGFPNDLVFDEDGNVYVTDSALGQIYKIDPAGTPAVWLRDSRLLGNAQHPPLGVAPFGANGIAFDRHQRVLYVDDTDFGAVYRVRVREDGSPGSRELFVSDPSLVGADGIAFDERGGLYVASNLQGHIVRIDRHGGLAVVAQGAPLDFPSSFAFGPERECGGTTLFISSFAIGEAIGIAPGAPHPSLDSIQVPFGGLPLP
jgi:sugar lactone lactonase YvrE